MSPRARLTRQGSDFLLNYARTVNSYPKRTEKEAILVSLHAIPGNEAFTIKKLASWFARHRRPPPVSPSISPTLARDPHPPVLFDDETILFPKLTPVHLQQLRVLYRKRVDPSDGIITFWANRISADREEVAAWIQYQQEKARENHVDATPDSPDTPSRDCVPDSACQSTSTSPTVSNFPRPHLPTPAKSLSPSACLLTRAPSLPQIAVKVEEPRQCLSPVSPVTTSSFPATSYTHSSEPQCAIDPLSSSLAPQQPPVEQPKLSPIWTAAPSALVSVDGKPSWRDSNAALAATIRDGLQPDAHPSEQPPRTAGEFAEKFRAVENMIDSFMKKYDSGQLTRLGWDLDPSKVAS